MAPSESIASNMQVSAQTCASQRRLNHVDPITAYIGQPQQSQYGPPISDPLTGYPPPLSGSGYRPPQQPQYNCGPPRSDPISPHRQPQQLELLVSPKRIKRKATWERDVSDNDLAEASYDNAKTPGKEVQADHAFTMPSATTSAAGARRHEARYYPMSSLASHMRETQETSGKAMLQDAEDTSEDGNEGNDIDIDEGDYVVFNAVVIELLGKYTTLFG